MSIRTVQTSFTSSAYPSAMSPFPNVLASLDLNTVYPPGLGAATPSWNTSPRSFHRPGNKRHPQGMRLPSSSYLAQNQYRRASFSSPTKSQKTEASSFGAPSYQRTSRFDPFGDSKETPLSPLSTTTQPVYTHYYYYDPHTNRPTLAYADEKNSVNAANLTASTNLLLDALLNGARRDIPSPPQPAKASSPIPARPQNRSPSPPQPSRPQTRSPSPPQSSRPRAAAISHPNPSPISAKLPTSLPESAPTPVVASAPPPAQPKMPKAQRDAIARVVANMLLNRSDGVSRRGRRCSQPYVKSGLSRVVTVE